MEIPGPTLSRGFGVSTLCQLTVHGRARLMLRALPVIICRDLTVCLDLQVHLLEVDNFVYLAGCLFSNLPR